MHDILDILEARGFLYQLTDSDALRHRLAQGPTTFYVGFDPTADSLHIGHLLPIMAMRQLQQAGHRPIALVGGGTALVGDPSGKMEARPILSLDRIAENAAGIRKQLVQFLDFENDRALLLNNAEWLADLRYITFLRDIGRHFSVNRMLAAESVKLRLETGLSFLEFNYTLLQAYDFYVLRRDWDCEVQFGGQDQWGNIVAGVDLTRRLLSKTVYGATFPLLLKGDGEKFGKTASGTVWLDPARTSPYDYYQFWRNVDDADVGRLLGFFTDVPTAEIAALGRLQAPAINRAKEILAFETTQLAHGPDEARRSYLAAGSEFGFADPDNTVPTSSRVRDIRPDDAKTDLPTHHVEAAALEAGIWIVALFVDCGLCSSNGEARRLVRGGGAYLNDTRVSDEKRALTHADLRAGQLLLRAGKKKVRRIVVDA